MAGGLAAVGSVVVLLFGLLSNEERVPRTSPVSATQESLAIGARLYENNCQVCHGPQGKGSALAVDLTLHVPIFNDGSLFVRISEGFPIDSDQKTMPAFGDQLTETERWHLVNFLRDAFGEPTFDPVLPEDLR